MIDEGGDRAVSKAGAPIPSRLASSVIYLYHHDKVSTSDLAKVLRESAELAYYELFDELGVE